MIGTTLQGRYRIQALLGEGGMGQVYRAYDTALDREVAIKLLSPGLGEQAKQRFLREARIAAKLDHPCIVTVHDVGEENGRSFIVMELAQGRTLHDLPPPTLEQTLDLATQICNVLDHAHSRGIVHRDIKSENILVDEQGQIKIMDFGLAHSLDASRLTQAGTMLGTVYYLAPEVAMGETIDARADLYSLGVLLYELTTGRLPFEGDDPLAIISQHLHAPVVPPSTHNPNLPPRLEALILHLLAKEPDKRPPSAQAVHQELESVQQQTRGQAPVVRVEEGVEAPPSISLLDRIVRGRLVGRRKELAELRAFWDRALQGQSHLVLISGEPGIGKTRLAQELIAYVRLQGAGVFQGHCYAHELAVPYHPFVEGLRDLARTRSPEYLKERLGDTAAEAVKLVPELEEIIGPIPPNPPLSPHEERLRLFDNFTRLLIRLSQARPFLFILEDLHWADEATLLLLQYVARNILRERILLLGTYRETELGRAHPFQDTLLELNRERLASRVPLKRLAREEVREMLEGMFGEAASAGLINAIYRETEGNPFFVEEVAKALVEEGTLYPEKGHWAKRDTEELEIPQSVKAVIAKRLEKVSPPTQEALAHAAVIGRDFEFEVLAAISEAGEERVINAIEEALQAQLIQESKKDGRILYTFQHALIQQTLYEELSSIRRQRLHRQVGEALERVYEGRLDPYIEALAYHFSQGDRDLDKGLRYNLQAGEKAAKIYANQDAIQFYSRAGEIAEAIGDRPTWAKVQERLGDLYAPLGPGAYEKALERYTTALSAVDDPQARGRLQRKIGRVLLDLEPDRAMDHFQLAMAELSPESNTIEVAHVWAGMGRVHHYHGHFGRALELYQQALDRLERAGDPKGLAEIYAQMAGCFMHQADYPRTIQYAEKALEFSRRAQFSWGEAAAHELLAQACAFTGSWDDTLRHAQLDYEIGSRIGATARAILAEYMLGVAYWGKGELARSLEHLQRSLEQVERLRQIRAHTWVQLFGALASADLGDWSRGESWALDAIRQADQLGQVDFRAYSRLALGYLRLRLEAWPQAIQLFQEVLDMAGRTELRSVIAPTLAALAEAQVGAQNWDQAAQVIEQGTHHAQQVGARHNEGTLYRVRGIVWAAGKKWGEAEAAFQKSLAILGQIGSRLELGRTRLAYAHLLKARDQLEKAEAEAQAALAIFEETGARPDAERAREALHSWGKSG